MAASALLSERQTPKESPHPHRPASMRNLAAPTADLTASSRRCVHPSNLHLNHGRHIMQTPTIVRNIGADVAKDEIVVACSEGSFPTRKLANQRTTLRAFLKSLPPGSRIGMESTGIYHELFASLAHQLGFIVYVLNPKDVRHYAKGVRMRGKTDRVDAELLARMVAHEHADLHPWVPPTPEQREIDRLIKRRAKLSSLRQALGMSLKGLVGFSTDLKALRQRFDQVIARIDQRVKELVEASPDRKQHVTHLRTINGVGPVARSSALHWLTPLSMCL